MSVNAIFDLTGKVALVTGAASGLGQAIAEALADAGAKLALFDLNGEGLREVASHLSTKDVELIEGDVSAWADVEKAVARCTDRFGRLDIAFANAGIGDPEPARIDQHDEAHWRKIVGINLDGVYNTNKAAIRAMLRTGGGKVINTASMWGLAGPSSVFPMPGYAATKGAVVNLTRELALQYARDNIQVNAICPGFFHTRLGPFEDADFMNAITSFTPMGRVADPSEIKGTALYLASKASDFVTGAMLVIDGGCMAK